MMTKFYGVRQDSQMHEIHLSHQSFSGTDTSKESGRLGIVYPFDISEEINNFVTASSIIDHHDDDSHLLKHTEVRIAHKEGDNLEYQKIKNTASIVLHNQEKHNETLNSYFEIDIFQDKTYCQVNNGIEMFAYDSELEQAYKEANTEVIVSDKNLEKKSYGFESFSSLNKLTKKIDLKDKDKVAKEINKTLKFLELPVEVDIDEVSNYLFDFESLYRYEQIQYNGFIEYMAFDIDSEADESLEAYRTRKGYSASKIFIISSNIKNLLQENYEWTLF